MAGDNETAQQEIRRIATALATHDDPQALATLDVNVRGGDQDRIYYALLVHEARSDFPRVYACLDRLAALADTPERSSWVRQHREGIERVQASQRPGDPVVSLLPFRSEIDDLLAPIIRRSIG
jgi:hypothetical protein